MTLKETNLTTIIRATNLTKVYYYNYNFVRALVDCNLDIQQGEFTAILGAKGSGKTTLLNLLGGLEQPADGTVFLGEQDIYSLKQDELAKVYRKEIGFIFQKTNLFPSLTVHENIILPALLNHSDYDRKFYDMLIDRMKLRNLRNTCVKKLTPCQQQSVAVLRALINKPDIILADEPTDHLDRQTGEEVLKLLFDYIHKYQKTLVMVTNRQYEYKEADHIIRLNQGVIVEDKRLSNVNDEL